ncbi:MAG: peptidoglycan-binding protein [Cyanobacteria bacterium P01_D01_bin.105]
MADTYISKVFVNLWKQAITLTWAGPNASQQPTGPFHCSPGRGLVGINCDIEATSRRANTNCTPKGEWTVLGYQRRFVAFPEAEWVTQFQSLERGIALHYYPVVPQYPASHGCVRVADYDIAKLIYDKTEPLKTKVIVHGELRPLPDILRRGQSGSAVEKMQMRLVEVGYSLSVDGDFGPTTEKIVKRFQQDAGLSSVDGVLGPATYDTLFENERSRQRRALARV